MVLALRTAQTEAVARMLSLNAGAAGTAGALVGGGNEEETYKVLILDRFCRDLVSPLLRVSDLRKYGVTLHLLLEAERQPIPDVPAIYFVQASAKAIERIALDAANGLYDVLHLNFASSLPRPQLEQLAASVVRSESLHRVARVTDQYLGFVALEQRMFTLAQPSSYARLHDPTARDSEVEAAVDDIVGGLFCVAATLGVVPVIRAQKGGAAEMIAQQLDARLRDHLLVRNNLFTDAPLSATSFQRPLLALFDRDFDLAVMLQHAWTYQPLVHDVLKLHLNRVVIQGDGPAAAKKSYDLDESDPFWSASAAHPFPKVAEEVEVQLNKYKSDVEEVNRQTSASGSDALDSEATGLLGSTKHLVSVVNSLPELTERKRVIDKHTNLATALLNQIKARALDNFCALEDELLAKSSADMKALLAALRATSAGTAEDKLRLAIVYLLSSENPPEAADLESVEAALQESGAPLEALHYIRQMRALSSSLAAHGAAAQAQGRSQLLDWADKLYGSGLSAVTAGVKNLLGGHRQLAVVKAVEALMEGKPSPETDAFLLFDPKAPRGAVASTASGGPESTAARARGPYREAIVFMIGGGNYKEYLSLQEMAAKQQPAKAICYGSTEILTGADFLAQLSELGHKAKV